MENVLIEFLDNSSYFAILTTLSSDDPIDLLRDSKANDYLERSGKIIVDNILHVGNNSDRFMELFCDNGKIDYSSLNFVEIARKDELRIKANNTLRQHPSIVNNSILNSSQKKLLLHGISI